MKRTILVAGVAACLGVLVACSNTERTPTESNAIHGSGVLISESRTLAAFAEVILAAAGDVNVTLGSPQSVSITVDNNIMPHLVTEVNSGRLLIELEDDYRAVDYDLTVDVVMTEVESLVLAGAGAIVGQNQIQAEELELTLAGSGTINMNTECNRLSTIMAGQGGFTLLGSTAHHTCVLAGSGWVRAFELVADTSQVTLAGQGDIKVNTIDRLNVIISGIGDVYYRGNPTVTWTITGVGQVIDDN